MKEFLLLMLSLLPLSFILAVVGLGALYWLGLFADYGLAPKWYIKKKAKQMTDNASVGGKND